MKMSKGLNRRSFLRNVGLAATGAIVGCNKVLPGLDVTDATRKTVNTANAIKNLGKLPKWKGFNLNEFFQPDPWYWQAPTPEEYFKWMADWGFDFVRIPVAYPTYINIAPYERNITVDNVYSFNEAGVNKIERTIYLAHKYNLHVSLCLHRAPGYCVSTGYYEPFNLWLDQSARDAFYKHWWFWANRFKNVSAGKISFDLVNEPCFRANVNDPASPTSAVSPVTYRSIAQTATDVIRKENPAYIVIADGNNGGATAVPELADLKIGQSCRGYTPFEISHYKAPWVYPDRAYQPTPLWPGTVGGQYFSRALLEEHYKPWIELAKQGVGVHCGECGCVKDTPHDVFLAWFGDVLDILGTNGIGFSLWEFSGDFGVLNSNRADVQYENWYGHQLDRKLLTLLQSK